MKSFFGILVATTLAGSSFLVGQGPAPLRKAPELAFTIPGEGQRLLSQYRGKVVALGFISTTCPHCQAAAQEITKYQQEWGKRGFQAIDLAINALDGPGGEKEAGPLVTDFSKKFGVGFPVGYITRAEMMSFMRFTPLDRMVVPQMALIDRKGFIHYQTPAASGPEWDAVMKEPNLRQHIEELLALTPTTSTPHPKGKMVATSAKK